MKKFSWCLLLVLCVMTGPPTASAQQIQLDVQGDTLIVVKTFPVTVSVPKGFTADLYFWSVPPGVTFQDEGASVKIFAAPKGTLAIGLKTIKVDWDQKKLTQQFGSVAIVIGDVPGPAPPIPPPLPPPVPPGPAPPAALVQSLKSALALDGEFEGRAKAKLFAAVAREMGPVCMDSAGFVKTGNDILAVWKISVSKTLAPGDIFQVRLTAAKWLDTQMPANRTVALTNEARANMRDTFLLLALAIEEAAK